MSKLSDKKKEKISEQILSVLYDNFPKPIFTSQIAKDIVRDEEFTKSLLTTLKTKGLVVPVNKNPEGIDYVRRIRWRLANNTQKAYSDHTSP